MRFVARITKTGPNPTNAMNNAVMRATLTRIGFSKATAQATVEDQGINYLNKMKLMTADNKVEAKPMQDCQQAPREDHHPRRQRQVRGRCCPEPWRIR